MRTATIILILASIFTLNSYSAVTPESTAIDFSQLADSGICSTNLMSVTPSAGCLKLYPLEFPTFTKGVINRARITSWVAGYLTGPSVFSSFSAFGNLTYDDIADDRLLYAFDNGYYLLLELTDGRYLAILPLVSDEIMASITVYEGVPRLKLCTFGTDTFTGSAPLFTWAFADDPYTATRTCWEHAITSDFCKDNIQWRSQKEYPEPYNYLGWCTWESLAGNINEANVTQSILDIKSSSVPVRWVIVDGGYLNDEIPDGGGRTQILNFDPNGNRFPNGWDPITSLKDDNDVKWMGLWRNMSGGKGGVSPNHTMTNLTDHLMGKTIYEADSTSAMATETYSMVVKPDAASSTAFYEEMVSNTLNGGYDFLKVDFQTYNFWMYYGIGNAVTGAHQNNQALEAVCKTNNAALLNCISQSNVNVFNTRHSVLARASVDIKLDLPVEDMKRTRQSFANNMWWGEILIGDFDMYHTSSEEIGQYMTIARAVSGGPVYISDTPTEFDDAMISPVIFSDGEIIRAQAPAVPLPDSLFSKGDTTCYRVISPTRHRSCAIAAFNFSSSSNTLTGTLSANDYPNAGAKQQPYTGLWTQPAEGLVVFDQQAQTGSQLTGTYSYSVDFMKGRIFTLAPITNGWAVIGRSDKYLGGCTYTIDSCSAESLTLTLDESGPTIVYNQTQVPLSSEGSVTDLGGGFYRINLPAGETDKQIIITPDPNAQPPLYLSDLEWDSATIGWGTIKKDLSIDGNPLTLNGNIYPKGIGTHAVSEIVYTIPDGYDRFACAVGLDDEENGTSGQVGFEVWIDGMKYYDSGAMTDTSETQFIELSITGKSELKLIATDGGNGTAYDHADWADARFISGTQNLIQNGSFETGTDANWTISSPGEASISPEQASDGSYALKLMSSDGFIGNTSQQISVQPNTDYTFTCDINYPSSGTVGTVTARLNIDGVKIKAQATSATSGWETRELTFNSGASTHITLDIYADSSFTGTAYLDNFSLSTASGYTVWAFYTGITGTKLEDDDNDGLNNLAEYAVGEKPTITRSGSTFTYVHNQRTDDSTLSFTVETCTDLVAGNWTSNSVTFLGAGTLNSEFSIVTNSIPTTEAKSYIRLKVQQQ